MRRTTNISGLTLFGDDSVLQRQLVPLEVNLEGWPLFSRKKTRTDGAMEVRESISTADGRRLDQVWRVTASHDFSLPGTFDEDVFVGVMALVRQRGGMPTDGKIRFSLYELLKVLGKSKRGGLHDKVRQSLDRIGSTIYYSENAFYVMEDERLETYRFTLWSVHFSRAQSRDGRSAEHHTLKFDDLLVKSYNSGYLKLLDTDLYFALGIPLAKALYRLVDQRRGESRGWEVDALKLRDLLAMSRSYGAPSRIWEVLTPAIGALKREKYLQSAELDSTGVARFLIHQEYARDWYPEIVEDPPSLNDQAIEALKGVGVWPKRARALVEQYGPEKALHALDAYEVQMTGRKVPNPGAYVAGIVESGDAAELAELAEFHAAHRAANGAGSQEQPQDTLIDVDGATSPDDSAPPPLPDPAAQEILDLMVSDLCDAVSSALRVWFAEVVAVSLSPDRITLSLPNPFVKDYIKTRLHDHLLASLRTRHTPHATIEFLTRSTALD